MNRPAIENLASFIEHRQDIRFDYSDGGRCIYGFARMLFGIPMERTPTNLGSIVNSKVNDVLGIDNWQAAHLFIEPKTVTGNRIDHPQVSRTNAVETLKRFAETGVIFFNEPTVEDRKRGASCNCSICSGSRLRPAPINREDFRREREAMRAEAVHIDQMLRSDRRTFTHLDGFDSPQVVEARTELAGEPFRRVEEPQTA